MAISSQPLAAASAVGNRSAAGRNESPAWLRSVIPSLSDLFFLSVLVWLAGPRNGGWQGLLGDCDAGWHIRTGEWILNHRTVPVHDLFSFSKASAPWFAWEWLSDVLFASLYRWCGLEGVVLLAGIVIALVAWLLLRQMLRLNANAFAALLAALLAMGAASVHFWARPHILTMLMLVASMWLVREDLRAKTRRIWLLVPLTLLWTNLHGGFVALLACLGLLVAGTAAETWLAGGVHDWRPVRRYSLLLGACSLVTLVNPYGIQLHLHIAQYLGGDWIKKVVDEFQSPSFRTENMFQFEVMLLLGVVAAGYLLKRRQITEALWILFWAHESLTSVRHVPLFVIIAAPPIALELTRWWDAWTAGASRKSLRGILGALTVDFTAAFRRSTVWLVLPLVLLICAGSAVKWPSDFSSKIFPVEMLNRHASQIVGTRIFTSDQWGDYLIYRFYPAQHVFFDGRSDFYGEKLGEQYQHLSGGDWQWQSILNRWDFRYALVPPDWALCSLLKQSHAWKILDDDGRAVLFERTVDTRGSAARPAAPVAKTRAGD